jgi:hypothetical protein
MSWKFSVFLIAILYSSGNAIAQEKSYNPFYVELDIAPLINFGSKAEIKGGYDSVSHDKQEHLNPAFKSSTAIGLVFGYVRKNWVFESTISYFQQDMTLVTPINWSTNGPKLATANFISAKVSALFFAGKTEWWPYGLNGGFFIGTVSSFSYEVDPAAKAKYGISSISNQTQLNWGIESNFCFTIGKKGFFGNIGGSLTMPGVQGGVGKIQSNSSGYTVVEETIVMYSLNVSAGVGLRIGKLKQMTP